MIKKIYFGFFLLLSSVAFAQAPISPTMFHRLCFGHGQAYSPLNTNYSANASPVLGTSHPGCLYSSPAPTWSYLQIDQSGSFLIQIDAIDLNGVGRDVDFICWGPFQAASDTDFLNDICTNNLPFTLTGGASHRPSAGNHSSNLGGYPVGNIVDCSYDVAADEWCYIPNAQSGEYYLLLTTNFSAMAGFVRFTKLDVPYAIGTTFCPTLYSYDTVHVCENDFPFTYGDTTFEIGAAPGTWCVPLVTSWGQDSVACHSLVINAIDSTEFTVCNSTGYYVWEDSTYAENGDYIRTLTNSTGCDSVVTLHLTVNVGVEDNPEDLVSIYPNPTNDFINIDGGQSDILEVSIYDMQGKLVYTQKNRTPSVHIDLGAYVSGGYLLKVTTDRGTVVRKIEKR